MRAFNLQPFITRDLNQLTEIYYFSIEGRVVYTENRIASTCVRNKNKGKSNYESLNSKRNFLE